MVVPDSKRRLDKKSICRLKDYGVYWSSVFLWGKGEADDGGGVGMGGGGEQISKAVLECNIQSYLWK